MCASRVVGHDRGARVGYRLALDHPGRLERLALLDILPTFHVWAQMRAGAVPAAHWGFLSEPYPKPETGDRPRSPALFRGADGEMVRRRRRSRPSIRGRSPPTAQSCNEPTRIHAFCEDYRAGATVDIAQDEADLAAGRRDRAARSMSIWSEFYLTGGAARRRRSPSGSAPSRRRRPATSVVSGHFVAEENPDATLEALRAFLGIERSRRFTAARRRSPAESRAPRSRGCRHRPPAHGGRSAARRSARRSRPRRPSGRRRRNRAGGCGRRRSPPAHMVQGSSVT